MPSPADARRAELLLVEADVRTLDRDDRRAGAVAVGGGRILAVGDEDDVRPLAGPSTEVVALGGRTVLPGINDAHAHVGWWALAHAPRSLDLRAPSARSIAGVQRAVAAAAAGAPAGTWIVGMGWDQRHLEEGRPPTRHDLDAVASGHPVALTHFSGHALWVNTAALRTAGVDRSTMAPAGSLIVHDERGEPTGVLVEPGATGLIARHVPPPATPELAGVLRAAIADLHARGITSFTEPAIAPGDPDRAFAGAFLDAYDRLADRGELLARVNVLEWFHTAGVTAPDDVAAGLAATGEGSEDEQRRLRVRGVKVFADGVFSGRTSWVREPYVGGGTGSLVVAGDDERERVDALRAIVALAHRAGRQVQIHATGDAAVEASVDALVDAMRETPRPDPRHVIIHGVLSSPEVLDRMARHGIVLNAQPTIARHVGDNLFDLLGDRRARDQSPLRWAADRGVALALSTDIPIAPAPDWRATVADAVARRTTGGRIIARQRLTLGEALRAVTIGGAHQDHAETSKGTIEPGKVADLCVLDGTLDDPEGLRETGIAATVFDGAVVHRIDAL